MTFCSNNVPKKAGVGLRHEHYDYFLTERPKIPWLEIHPENYKAPVCQKILTDLRKDYPLSFHSVGLSLGSAEGVNTSHLQFLKNLIEIVQPGLVSDHVSWSINEGIYLNDLIPVPYNKESLQVLADNIQKTQDFLGKQILVENPSSYLEFSHSDMSEPDFLNEVVKKTGCQLLLDVNNVYVSAVNHGWDAKHYIDQMPSAAIGEIHLAGHSKAMAPTGKEVLIDTHSDVVCDAVWELYAYTIKKHAQIPTLMEWDDALPEPKILLHEAEKAQEILDSKSGKAV